MNVLASEALRDPLDSLLTSLGPSARLRVDGQRLSLAPLLVSLIDPPLPRVSFGDEGPVDLLSGASVPVVALSWHPIQRRLVTEGPFDFGGDVAAGIGETTSDALDARPGTVYTRKIDFAASALLLPDEDDSAPRLLFELPAPEEDTLTVGLTITDRLVTALTFFSAHCGTVSTGCRSRRPNCSCVVQRVRTKRDGGNLAMPVHAPQRAVMVGVDVCLSCRITEVAPTSSGTTEWITAIGTAIGGVAAALALLFGIVQFRRAGFWYRVRPTVDEDKRVIRVAVLNTGRMLGHIDYVDRSSRDDPCRHGSAAPYTAIGTPTTQLMLRCGLLNQLVVEYREPQLSHAVRRHVRRPPSRLLVCCPPRRSGGRVDGPNGARPVRSRGCAEAPVAQGSCWLWRWTVRTGAIASDSWGVRLDE